MTKYIAYYRVSTQQQGKSGLGLDAQKTAVEDYLNRLHPSAGVLPSQNEKAGAKLRKSFTKLVPIPSPRRIEDAVKNSVCSDVHNYLLKSYTEIESGRNSARPELAKALKQCKREGATLIIAKLDRLARKVSFISTLMDSGVEFLACDNPHATRFTTHVMAAVAEHEAQQISDRTKAALAAARANGTKLGSARPGHWKGREEARQRGADTGGKISGEKRTEQAADAYAEVVEIVNKLRAEGYKTRHICEKLNSDGYTTQAGYPFTRQAISRILLRANKAS